jgi:glutathione peroxidase
MNNLVEQFGDKIAVLGFPSNQFGHQSNENDDEFLNVLKYVRPGHGYEPKFPVFQKGNVNGKAAQPLFKWMKTQIPYPQDPPGDTKGNGCDNNDALLLPRGAFDETTVTLWSPVARSDIAWNFEKFLLNQRGEIVKRYSRYYSTAAIAEDIAALLK